MQQCMVLYVYSSDVSLERSLLTHLHGKMDHCVSGINCSHRPVTTQSFVYKCTYMYNVYCISTVLLWRFHREIYWWAVDMSHVLS